MRVPQIPHNQHPLGKIDDGNGDSRPRGCKVHLAGAELLEEGLVLLINCRLHRALVVAFSEPRGVEKEFGDVLRGVFGDDFGAAAILYVLVLLINGLLKVVW